MRLWCGLPGKLRSHGRQSWSLWLWGRGGGPSAFCAGLSSSGAAVLVSALHEVPVGARHAPVQQHEAGTTAHSHERGGNGTERLCHLPSGAQVAGLVLTSLHGTPEAIVYRVSLIDSLLCILCGMPREPEPLVSAAWEPLKLGAGTPL